MNICKDCKFYKREIKGYKDTCIKQFEKPRYNNITGDIYNNKHSCILARGSSGQCNSYGKYYVHKDNTDVIVDEWRVIKTPSAGIKEDKSSIFEKMKNTVNKIFEKEEHEEVVVEVIEKEYI